MLEKIDKRSVAQLFRDRLTAAMTLAGLNQAQLARAIGVDRSTVSQILQGSGARLPNVHLAAAAARHLGVSADWLLGLSEHREMAADLVDASLEVTAATRTLIDDQLYDWHVAAAGYKIRHVPTGLPDMLKTEALLEWEYAPHRARSSEQAVEASQRRLDWMRQTTSDLEIALPRQQIEGFARGEGLYRDLPDALRREQLHHMAQVAGQLYPALRLYLFDLAQWFSTPMTVFGPLMAAVYIGQNYLVFRDSRRVAMLSAHFDRLVREAEMPSRDVTGWIAGLAAQATVI